MIVIPGSAQCVSTRRHVELWCSGARAAQIRWGRGGQGGPDPPHPAADCEDVTEKVLTFADTNPRMKLGIGGTLNDIREYDSDPFLLRYPHPITCLTHQAMFQSVEEVFWVHNLPPDLRSGCHGGRWWLRLTYELCPGLCCQVDLPGEGRAMFVQIII